MNLRDLSYVLALAETRHFGRAAAQCFVSQPTLSMQIAKLEQELGVVLFERDRRRVNLTPVGRRIVSKAAAISDAVREIQEIARADQETLRGPLYLGVIPTIGPYFLPHILPELRRVYPGVELYLREGFTERLLEDLHGGELDAAILSLPLDDPGIAVERLYDEAFVLALPPGHRLSGKTRLGLEEMAGETILLLEEGNCMRDQTLGLCRGRRPAHHDEFRASSVETLRQMVAAGIGCTFLPQLSAQGPFAASSPVEIRSFKDPVPTRAIVLAYRKTYPRGESMRRLAEALRGRLAGGEGE